MKSMPALAQAVEKKRCEMKFVQRGNSFTDSLICERTIYEKNNEVDDLDQVWLEDESGVSTMIANFRPEIAEEIQEIYLDKTLYKIRVRIMQKGKVVGDTVCSVADWGKPNFYYTHFGIASGKIWCKSKAEETIKELILQNRVPIPILKKYLYFGKSLDGTVFVSESLGVIKRREADKIEKNEMEYLLESLFKILPDDRIRVLFATALLAPMITSMAALNIKRPDFTVLLMAESGSRKTTIASLIFSYNRSGDAPVSFESSLAFIAEKLNQMRDHALLIDDLHPQKTSAAKKEQQEKLEMITRAAGDGGSARQTMKKGLAAKMQSNLIPIITSEFRPNLTPSSDARLLQIEFDKLEVDLDKLTDAQNRIDRYRSFFKKYIAYTMAEEEIVLNLYDRYNKHRKEYFELFPALHPRICSSYSWIRASFENFVIFSMKFLPEYRRCLETENEQFSEYLRSCLIQEEERMIQERGLKKYLDLLLQMKETSKVRFAAIREKQTSTIAQIEKNTVLIYDKDFLYFRTDLIAEFLNKQLRGDERLEGISGRRLREMMEEEGCLKRYNGLLTRSKQVNGKRIQVSVVDRHILKAQYGFSMEG